MFKHTYTSIHTFTQSHTHSLSLSGKKHTTKTQWLRKSPQTWLPWLPYALYGILSPLSCATDRELQKERPARTHCHMHSEHTHTHARNTHTHTCIFNWTSACNWPKLWWNCAKGALCQLTSRPALLLSSSHSRQHNTALNQKPYETEPYWTQLNRTEWTEQPSKSEIKLKS